MTFKCLNDTAPGNLEDLIHSYTPNRSLRSTSKNYLAHEQFHPKRYGLRVFSVAAPIFWNSLPGRLRDHSKFSISSFEKKLKTHLFKIAFLTCKFAIADLIIHLLF